MKSACIGTEDFGTILDLPEDAPERRHLEACPRCQARMATFLEFDQDRSSPPGADLEDAGLRLRAAFQDAIAPRPAAPIRIPSIGSSVRERFFPRRIRPMQTFVAAAAVMIVAVGLYAGLNYVRHEGGADMLRGRSVPDGEGPGEAISLLEPRIEGADAIRLQWRPVPGATSYEVLVLGSDLRDLARFSGLQGTTCVIRRTDFRPEPSPGTVVGWQVIGYRDGVAVLRSSIGAIRLP